MTDALGRLLGESQKLPPEGKSSFREIKPAWAEGLKTEEFFVASEGNILIPGYIIYPPTGNLSLGEGDGGSCRKNAFHLLKYISTTSSVPLDLLPTDERLSPTDKTPSSMEIQLSSAGRSAVEKNPKPYLDRARQGALVVLADLRFSGDYAPDRLAGRRRSQPPVVGMGSQWRFMGAARRRLDDDRSAERDRFSRG